MYTSTSKERTTSIKDKTFGPNVSIIQRFNYKKARSETREEADLSVRRGGGSGSIHVGDLREQELTVHLQLCHL